LTSKYRLENDIASTCAELGITLVGYAPLSQGFLTGQIKSFHDLAENDWRRHSPRFQPDVFDENMKLVNEVKKIAERKGCTVSFHTELELKLADGIFRALKSRSDGCLP
jgi:pyridoxine 4-dehydrogenase